MILKGRCIVEGYAEGRALVSKDPISFMGGVDPKTGKIIERGNEIEGECIKDKILVFPSAKGSTGGSYMLYEAVKNKVGPKAIVNSEAESIVVIGAIVSDLPMVDRIDISLIKTVNATEGEIIL
jgi:predicted aconitase with swiveling domain